MSSKAPSKLLDACKKKDMDIVEIWVVNSKNEVAGDHYTSKGGVAGLISN